MQKRLNAMFKKKSARPDDLAKAGKQLEATIIKTSTEVKKMVDAARKTMEHA
jgi:ribosome recycling factor